WSSSPTNGQQRRDWRISMSKLKLNITMSLHGYVAGPDQSTRATALGLPKRGDRAADPSPRPSHGSSGETFRPIPPRGPSQAATGHRYGGPQMRPRTSAVDGHLRAFSGRDLALESQIASLAAAETWAHGWRRFFAVLSGVGGTCVGMYLRTTQRWRKDGSLVRYLLRRRRGLLERDR